MKLQPGLFETTEEDRTARRTTPVVNPDGISVKGCNFIYAPKGQAGEYSALAANPYRGCTHRCAYCYVPSVLQIQRDDFYATVTPRPHFLENLQKDTFKYQVSRITEQVMFSFTCDPYNPTYSNLTRPSLQIVQAHGMGICVLTKGGSRALKDMDLYRPGRDAFASTLTTLNDDFSLKWEPGAALPDDRIDTLRKFHAEGIFTWVSLEPVISVGASVKIVETTHTFVDLYKIGRANYLPMTKTTDWAAYTHEMVELVKQLGVKYYFKHDLQPYLPEDFPNLQRQVQHN